MSDVETTVTVDRVTGLITCTLGYWYTRATCVVTIAISGRITILADGENVDDHEDRAAATKDALLAVAKYALGMGAR